MSEQPYLERMCAQADERGLEVLVENRFGCLFLKIRDPGLGLIAMWPAFDGSIESTARYAYECFEHMP